jgi:hypothetical protein
MPTCPSWWPVSCADPGPRCWPKSICSASMAGRTSRAPRTPLPKPRPTRAARPIRTGTWHWSTISSGVCSCDLIRQDYPRLVRLIPRLLARSARRPGAGDPLSAASRSRFFSMSSAHCMTRCVEEHRRAVAAARAHGHRSRRRWRSHRRCARRRDPRHRAFARLRAGHGAGRRRSSRGATIWQPAEQSVGAWVGLAARRRVGLGAQLTWIGRNRNLFMFVSARRIWPMRCPAGPWIGCMTQERIRVLTAILRPADRVRAWRR